jgi:hypothetical protein
VLAVEVVVVVVVVVRAVNSGAAAAVEEVQVWHCRLTPRLGSWGQCWDCQERVLLVAGVRADAGNEVDGAV